MAQRKPEEKVTVDQVFKLVKKLTPTEQGELRSKLDASWAEQWDALVARVDERNNGLPPMTEEEVYAEFTEHRREAKRAQSGN